MRTLPACPLPGGGGQERGAVGPFLEGEDKKHLSKKVLRSQKLLKSLWLHLYCRRLAGLGNFSHEEINTRRHNLPSPPDRGSQCPRQGAGKLLLRAQENSTASRRKQQPGILDIPPWREGPLEQGHSGSPSLPTSALTACAVPALAAGLSRLPLLMFRTFSTCQPARFLQLPMPPWRTGSGCCSPRPGGSAGSQHPFSDTAASGVTGSCWIAAAAMLMASSRLCCSSI